MASVFSCKNTNIAILLLSLSSTAFALTLDDYKNPNPSCFNRATNSHLTVADTHVHFRPFSGESVSYQELLKELRANGVIFAGVMGIGQRLRNDAPAHCESYRDCPGEAATPTTKNDWVNAANLVEFKAPGMELIYSMTFADLAQPSDVASTIALYDKEYPGMFKVMGESNVVKQALFPNHHVPVTTAQIDSWASFMPTLQARGIPFLLHSDLGNDIGEPRKYLPLIEYALKKYPSNKIVWLHLGISSEQKTIPPTEHIAILTEMLQTYHNLYLDTSWGVLEENYFSKHRQQYAAFINLYSERIISGSDYVAYKNKAPYNYTGELKTASEMNKYVSDAAFRNIALGQTYLSLLGLTGTYNAPQICPAVAK